MRKLIFLMIWLCASQAQARSVYPNNDNWLYKKEDGAERSYTVVSLPHTYNATDADNGGGYYRGRASYIKTFTSPCGEDQLLFLEFEGVASRAEVFVNDKHLGGHEGPYTLFRIPVPASSLQAENRLRVEVDNSNYNRIAPLGGDFSIFGGIYRPARFICSAKTHFDLEDFGGPGVYVRTAAVEAAEAQLEVRSRVRNLDKAATNLSIRTSLVTPDGQTVVSRSSPVTVAAGGVTEVRESLFVSQPRVWDGVKDPVLYQLSSELLSSEGQILDTVVTQVGIRTLDFDPDQGLLLNGYPYSVYGVNYHLSQRPGKGTAVSDQEIAEDFAILDELGLTGIRLAHYPHPGPIYEHADKQGYLLWSEIPLVARVDRSQGFVDNAGTQLKEMIRQNYNHPSVFVWGLGNEIYDDSAATLAVLGALEQIAKKEDPDRPTVYANCCGPVDRPITRVTDLNASNIYHGWYPQQRGGMSQWLDEAHQSLPNRALAVSEYGAGASIKHQQDPPQRPETDGDWHPEQYQALVHEASWNAIRSKDFLWASFVWVAFDFASDGRSEGDRAGINDKGLVTYDRKVKKYAYYWYKANWSGEPVVYISSRRHTQRTRSSIEVKVYSNQPRLQLLLNDQLVSEKEVQGALARWDIRLKKGPNHIVVRSPDGSVKDSVQWTLADSGQIQAGFRPSLPE